MANVQQHCSALGHDISNQQSLNIAGKVKREAPLLSQEGTKGVVQYAPYVSIIQPNWSTFLMKLHQHIGLVDDKTQLWAHALDFNFTRTASLFNLVYHMRLSTIGLIY
jgi:hypothetical protein